jgi:cytochrome c553
MIVGSQDPKEDSMKTLRVALGTAVVLMATAGSAVADDAKKAPDGKPIFLSYKCSSCHEIASQGITKPKAAATPAATPAAPATPGTPATTTARKPPDLSGVGMVRKADWIKGYLQKTESIEDRKHMKAFKGTDQELATLAGWLESLKDEKAAKAMKEREELNAGEKKAEPEKK